MAARNRSGELEAVCQQTEASAEETGRRLLLERDTNARLQAELQDVNLERDKMQVSSYKISINIYWGKMIKAHIHSSLGRS